MNLADLKKPFPPERISWRVGSTNADKTQGMALAYIDARDVQDRLDEVCGVNGWQCRYVPMHDKKTVCEIGIYIRIPGSPPDRADLAGYHWIWKADGAGDSDVEAEKGALSDAFKRAAVKWGIGRYLYDLDSPWVKIEASGRSYKIAQTEYSKLRKMLEGNKEPDGDTRTHVTNWCDQQKDVIAAAKMLPDLTGWLDSHGGNWVSPATQSNLARLKAKAPTAFNDLKTYYMEKLTKV